MTYARSKKDNKPEDVEELMRRKFRAKCQFRMLGRMVMDNVYWLIEGIDEYEGFEDTKRRVAQAVRGKFKKQLLSIHDKALLNKPAEERTDAQKIYLNRIIGGLKCFKRYPNHVKKKLAALTYFKYYGPGRCIVRQYQEAHAMYFIVTGDVIVSQTVWDELLEQWTSVDIGVMHPGDMFGEVSLLHNIPRTATCSTSSHCELLALLKEDFKNVLLASVQAQWDVVRRAMCAFTYFEALDEQSQREGCIVAKMKSFAINDTILGDGCGIPNYVYFVLKGQCQMIESLQVIVTTHLGREHYKLHDPYVPKTESEDDIYEKYFRNVKTPKSRTSSIPNEGNKTEESINKEGARKSGSGTVMDLSTRRVSIAPAASQPGSRLISTSSENKASYKSKTSDDKTTLDSHYIMIPSEEKNEGSATRAETIPENSELVLASGSLRSGVGTKDMTKHQPKTNQPDIRTYFMQVCQFNPGSTFGFGENMRDRRIIALTPVEVMLMPKVWLLQRNTANIWTRIQHYLDRKIIPKSKLFREFVNTRAWMDFKDMIVDDVVSRSRAVNHTSVHDVPYSIRLEDMVDIRYTGESQASH